MGSVQIFYGKQTKHGFLSNAVNQIQDDDPESADAVIIGPPTGRQDSGMENEDDEILNTTGFPEEIAGEVEIFSIKNDEIERMVSDDKDSDVEPPPAEKQNKMLKNPR